MKSLTKNEHDNCNFLDLECPKTSRLPGISDCTMTFFFNAIRSSQASEATEIQCNIMEMSCDLELEEQHVGASKRCPFTGGYNCRVLEEKSPGLQLDVCLREVSA